MPTIAGLRLGLAADASSGLAWAEINAAYARLATYASLLHKEICKSYTAPVEAQGCTRYAVRPISQHAVVVGFSTDGVLESSQIVSGFRGSANFLHGLNTLSFALLEMVHGSHDGNITPAMNATEARERLVQAVQALEHRVRLGRG